MIIQIDRQIFYYRLTLNMKYLKTQTEITGLSLQRYERLETHKYRTFTKIIQLVTDRQTDRQTAIPTQDTLCQYWNLSL